MFWPKSWGDIEYFGLRLVRRFLLNETFLIRFGKWIPYYQVNSNQADVFPVIDSYTSYINENGGVGTGVILEIGSGATNRVGYLLAERFPEAKIVLFEPYVQLDERADKKCRELVSSSVCKRVTRVTTLSQISDQSISFVFSNSVLEHVRDMHTLFAELFRVLKPLGKMRHAVDYRDHFFKYPYHFLLFSSTTWDKWLNPGDLPRWRLDDHLGFLSVLEWDVDVINETVDLENFYAIHSRLAPNFCGRDKIDVTSAVISVTKNKSILS